MRSRRFGITVALLTLLAGGKGRADPDESPRASALVQITPGWAGSSINVVANRRHALFSHGDQQYAAFYDPAGRMLLARRSVASSHWEIERTNYSGNVADAHNSISFVVDGSGTLHVAWDHHGQRLNYARSVRPDSLTLTDRLPMNGSLEDRVTYPEFHRLPDGDLICLYRDGWSGQGKLVLKRFWLGAQQWETVSENLIDGEGNRSPYWGATVDAKGQLHLAWIWRDTPDVATNHDLAYALSPDGGRTWMSGDGASLTPPFTLATSDYALRIPRGRNLMNSPWVTADAQGQPYLVSYWSDQPSTPPQFRVVYRRENRWHVETITERSDPFSLAGTATKRPPLSRGVLLVADDAAHLIYRDDAAGPGARMRSTPRLGIAPWTERALTSVPLDAWEPLIDPVQWTAQTRIHLLVQAVAQRDGSDTDAASVPPTDVAVLEVEPSKARESGAR